MAEIKHCFVASGAVAVMARLSPSLRTLRLERKRDTVLIVFFFFLKAIALNQCSLLPIIYEYAQVTQKVTRTAMPAWLLSSRRRMLHRCCNTSLCLTFLSRGELCNGSKQCLPAAARESQRLQKSNWVNRSPKNQSGCTNVDKVERKRIIPRRLRPSKDLYSGWLDDTLLYCSYIK